jgi:hypothetical protein
LWSGARTRLRVLSTGSENRFLPPRPSRGLARSAVVLCGLALALASVARTGAHTDHRLRADRADYAAMPRSERDTLYITSLGLPADPFAWYATYVGRGDRLSYQVMASGLGHFIDLPEAVEDVGRYDLLPARSVTRRSDANVIVSWDADPGLLHLRFESQQRLGLQLYFVSRIAR